MFYSDKIKNIANIYRNSFATIFQGYKDKCLENTNVLSDWKKKSATAEQYLNDEINSINHKFFRKKVHQLISLKNLIFQQCNVTSIRCVIILTC